MADTPNTELAAAAQMVSDAELAALKDLLAKAQAFSASMTAIANSLPFPAGFSSNAVRMANGMAANLSYLIATEIPSAIRAIEPQAAPGA